MANWRKTRWPAIYVSHSKACPAYDNVARVAAASPPGVAAPGTRRRRSRSARRRPRVDPKCTPASPQWARALTTSPSWRRSAQRSRRSASIGSTASSAATSAGAVDAARRTPARRSRHAPLLALSAAARVRAADRGGDHGDRLAALDRRARARRPVPFDTSRSRRASTPGCRRHRAGSSHGTRSASSSPLRTTRNRVCA
jgi:hypothetical protein